MEYIDIGLFVSFQQLFKAKIGFVVTIKVAKPLDNKQIGLEIPLVELTH